MHGKALGCARPPYRHCDPFDDPEGMPGLKLGGGDRCVGRQDSAILRTVIKDEDIHASRASLHRQAADRVCDVVRLVITGSVPGAYPAGSWNSAQ
jgi:hypothetical protein